MALYAFQCGYLLYCAQTCLPVSAMRRQGQFCFIVYFTITEKTGKEVLPLETLRYKKPMDSAHLYSPITEEYVLGGQSR